VLPASADGGVFPRDWSADGRFLLYSMDSATASRGLWLLPLDGEQKPSAFLTGEAIEPEGRFSPDGKWVLYVSKESGADEVYAARVGRPTRVRISDKGGSLPRWRRDGKEIVFVAPRGMITAVPVNLGETLVAAAPQTLFRTCSASQTLRGKEQYFDIGPDGNRFLMACLAPEAKPRSTTVSVNWLAAVKEMGR